MRTVVLIKKKEKNTTEETAAAALNMLPVAIFKIFLEDWRDVTLIYTALH